MKRFIIPILVLFASFNIFAQKQENNQAKEYLNFLYQYMPLSDRVDYDTNFFFLQVDYALKAKDTFAWTKQIPEDIYKHFVLVYRVNNEDLDTARAFMFKALKDRVKGLSMYDAALEVNHWCHEYVNYKASDGRTSAPLSTMRTSWGRCGEESTFTVTALRSVGIPARQCYTPRWAHTDDNHAWVEVWIDGCWYFLGACEPEAKLNVAWFTAPAKRAMMVHTTVFGKYDGKEEKNFESNKYSKINLLSNYAPTKKLTITVKNQKMEPIANAQVCFGLYNYAEYYPLAKMTTDTNGKCSLTTGYGDLVLWTKKDNLVSQDKVSKEISDYTVIIKQADFPKERYLELTPPKSLPIETLSKELIAKNNERLIQEDAKRNAYIATFPKTNDDLIAKSWGNYKNIQRVLSSNHPLARKMLNLVYEKDLRDVDYNTFMDHLNNLGKDTSSYIINPRIQLEKITPWRSFIKSYFPKGFKSAEEIAFWIEQNIKIDNKDNYYNVAISPKGVLTSGLSDEKSKEILFVAIARTFSIQARYEWATSRSQWRKDESSDWQYAFYKKTSPEKNNCILIVNSSKENAIKPEYYSHFTIEKLVDNEFITLDYEYDPHFLKFPDTLMLSQGQYRTVCGNRNSEGKIFVKEQYFTLKENKPTKTEILIPQAKEDINIYGNTPMNITLKDIKTTKDVALHSLIKQNNATIIAMIDPYKEPSRHLLVDVSKSKEAFDNLKNVYFVFVLDKSLLNKDFSLSSFPALPKNTYIVLDNDKSVEKEILNTTKIQFLNNYPILTLLSKQSDIIYFSQGYKISSQEELLKNIKKLK